MYNRGLRRSSVRSAARKIGITVDDYLEKVESGQKWCTKGRHWSLRANYQPSLSYSDGRSPICDGCRTRPMPAATDS